MAGGGDESAPTLEYSPTWIVALVCTVIVLISFVFERLLHRLGKVKLLHSPPAFPLFAHSFYAERADKNSILQVLKKKNQIPLFHALQKIKEGQFSSFHSPRCLYCALMQLQEGKGFFAELMLLGFISLLLVVFQGSIQRICISESLTHHLRPCKRDAAATSTAHYSVSSSGGIVGGVRRLLASGGNSTYCQKKVKFPLPAIFLEFVEIVR